MCYFYKSIWISFIHSFVPRTKIFPIVLDMFAHLIQSNSQACGKSLCYRTISTGTQGRSARVSTYACPQNVEGVTLQFLKQFQFFWKELAICIVCTVFFVPII